MPVTATGTSSLTVLDALIHSLENAAEYNKNDQTAPAVILWTDKDGQWELLAPRLRERLPQFLILGPYDPALRRGPAIWLRCMIARTLPEANWPGDTTPILYLPGISRQELRAVEDCPRLLQPLAELQYRGRFWAQLNAKDWTMLAFLQSKDGGLGLDVARDASTQEAMKGALLKLADIPVAELQDRRLEAADFHALLTPDPVRDLLQWLNNPDRVRAQWDESQWAAFRAICKETSGFDPQTDGVLTGGEKLGRRQGNWSKVWERFAEAPSRYPNVPELLRRATPPIPDDLYMDRSAWPKYNDEMESELRSALSSLSTKDPQTAAQILLDLEATHGRRRSWAWAELGWAPLAKALEHLAELGRTAQKPLGGATPDAMAQTYAADGWQVDAAVLRTLASIENPEDVAAVREAIRAVYRPWLEAAAERFQSLVKAQVLPRNSSSSIPTEGCCMLFADGLRYDVGQMLKGALEQRQYQVTGNWHWAALPPVTATAKPAVSPIVDLVGTAGSGEDFTPSVRETGKLLSTYWFTRLLQERNFQILEKDAIGDPTGRAWTEYGSIDHTGHEQGWKLAWRIAEEVRGLVARIETLLQRGWKKVRVVTDHGWLLLPGGLPKVALPGFLTETRWGRCAILKESASQSLLEVAWHWSESVRVAMAPGIACYEAGNEYAHGGLTLQECLVPTLIISSAAGLPAAVISSTKWVGLRCRINIDHAAPGMKVDIRTKPADSSSTIAAGGKPLGQDGTVSLVVEDDHFEGMASVIVLLDPAGNVIGKMNTTVGGD